jgi:dephospho-CoA kinase
VLDPSGNVRRDVLGPRAFADDASLARLDAIVRPPLIAELDRILAAYSGRPAPSGGRARLVILDAALIVEWDAGDRCDEIVAVVAKPEMQVKRLMKARDKSEEEARAVVARQLPAETRAAYADRVIENDGELEVFLAEARKYAQDMRSRLTPSPPKEGA